MYYGNSPLATRILSVVTPATATAPAGPYDLTTLTAIEGEPWYNSASLSSTWLQRLITACSLTIAEYCNRVFAVQTYAETIFLERDPPISVTIGGVAPLQLQRAPLVAASSSVTENGNLLTLGTDYIEDPTEAQLTRFDLNGLPMRWPKLQLSVQYEAGYAADSSDMAVLADACIEFVKWRAMSGTRDPGLKSQEIFGDISQQFLWGTGPGGPLDIPATVAGKIERYRAPVIG